MVPLNEHKYQILLNQLSLHINNLTNGGAVEIVSKEIGQNVTQYFKYNPDRNSVTVSNSNMKADFALQIPDPAIAGRVKINRINPRLLDVQYIIKNNETDTTIAFISYYTSYNNNPITIGNTTYNGIEINISIPNDPERYSAVMDMYLHP